MRSEWIGVRMSRKEAATLQAAAEAEDRSRGSILRRALAEYVARRRQRATQRRPVTEDMR